MDYLHGYRRRLPHLRLPGRTYFVTFRAAHRQSLPDPARDLAFAACVYEHEKTCWLDSMVIMPNHGHIVLMPYDEWPLERVMERIKRVSSHRIKKAMGLREVWEREYFDHMLRTDESMREKSEYICNNPVRAGLVNTPDEWRWLWRSWIEGKRDACAAP